MKNCIAVDIGGTKMLIAEVRGDGTIVQVMRFPTENIPKEEKVKNLIEGIKTYEKETGWERGDRPSQIGIGINGIIDPVKGIWKKIGSQDTEAEVISRVEKEFDAKCYIDNDVKCTVIAENIFGAGKGCRDMVYINVGTGLAAGVIAGGKLIRGSDGFAGEVGFMNFTAGEGIHIEMLASGMGMDYQAKRLLPLYPDSLLREKANGNVTGWDIFEAADRRDQLAEKILEDMVKMSGLLISNLTCVLSPEIVVLGGGLITNGRLLTKIADTVLPKARAHLEKGVVLTKLDSDYAGLMGAAAIGLGYQEQYF